MKFMLTHRYDFVFHFRHPGMVHHGIVTQREEACTTDRRIVRVDRIDPVLQVAAIVEHHTVVQRDH